MKRKLLMLIMAVVVAMTASVDLSAQNANRKGWIVGLQSGQILGTVYETADFATLKEAGAVVARRTGGAYGAINFGYRWTTSQSCAVEAKAFVSENFAESKMLMVGVMPGFRYTTKELFGNSSMYMGANLGVGLAPLMDTVGAYFIPEANIGFNLGTMISLGVFMDCNIPLCGDFWSEKYNHKNYEDLKTNIAVGLKMGLRF